MEEKKCCGGHKLWLMILIPVLLAAVIIVALLRDRLVAINQNQVSVIGQGRVSYQPDLANVIVGVQIDKVAKAEDALKQLNEKINKISGALRLLGVKDEDIKTQNYSLSPQYDSTINVGNNISSSVLSGYSANEQLVVKVKDIKNNPNNLNKVVEAASAAGANQILGIAFDLSNTEELKQQARLAAISDAKSKAGKLAPAAGVKLGKIIGWWENVVQAPNSVSGAYYGMGGADKGGVGVSSYTPGGSQEIVIEMNLNYRVK